MGHLKVKKATYLEKWFNPVSNVDVSFSESTFFNQNYFSVGRFVKRGNKRSFFVLFWSSSSFRQKRSNNFGRLQTPSLRLEIFSPFQKKVEEEEE